MARITPPTNQTDLSMLKDYEPYKAEIKNIDWQETDHPQYGHQVRMVIDWALEDNEDFTIRDWVPLRLGRKADGQISRLRQILNAVGLQPEATEISWFDDEDLTWSYDGEKPYAKLDIGLPVIIRGKTVEKVTESGPKRRFVITAYQPAGIAQKAEPKTVRGRPSIVKNDEDDEVPF